AGHWYGGSAQHGFTDSVTTCNGSASLLCFQVDYVAAIQPPSPAPAFKWAFVSGFLQIGGGLASADAKCDADAMAAGLTTTPGQFTALVAPTGQTPASRISTSGVLPYMRPDNVIVVAKDSDLFSSALWLAPIEVRADLALPSGYAFLGSTFLDT